MEKENENKLLSNLSAVIFIGLDLSIYKSLKNLTTKTGDYLLKASPYKKSLIKEKNLILLDDSLEGLSDIIAIFKKFNFDSFFLLLKSENIEILKEDNLKGFLKPLKIFELNKEIIKKMLRESKFIENWKLDRAKLQFYKNKSSYLQLTEKEYYLISYLIENKKNVVSKNEILSKVWGMDLGNKSQSVETRVVETLISKIRKKLNRFKTAPKIKKLKEGYKILI